MMKWIALLMAAVLALSLTAAVAETADSDLAYIQAKGVLVVGITDFEPIDYIKDGEWVGFDADMAKAFAASLGVEVQFEEIEWSNKLLDLENKSIDCIWNGMTLRQEITDAAACSLPYANNSQVIVVKADAAAQYQTAEACKALQFAVEEGSGGQDQAEAYGFTYTPVSAQSDAVMEVQSGSSDAAIIDLLMALAMTGEGTSYADLTYTVRLNDEVYGVAFRQGSDVVEKLNQFFIDSWNDGTMQNIADTYGIAELLIAQGA